MIPHGKWSALTKGKEPNEEMQTDFGSPILSEKGIRQYNIIVIVR